MPPKHPQKTIGYLRVSTAEQDIEKNKADILLLGACRRKKFPGVDKAPPLVLEIYHESLQTIRS